MKRNSIPSFAVDFEKWYISCRPPICPYCNKPVRISSSCNPDEICHIKSHKHGGKEVASNLIIGHKKCNRQAGETDLHLEDVNDEKYFYFGKFWTDIWTEKEGVLA